MKTILSRYLPLFLFGVILILLSIFAFNQWSENKAIKQSEQAEIKTAIIQAENRISAYYIDKKNAELDSLLNIEQKKIEQIKADKEKYRKEADKLRITAIELQRKYDKLEKENAPCPELLNVCLEINDTIRVENKELRKSLNASDAIIDSYAIQLEMTEEQKANTEILVVNAKKQIAADEKLIQDYKNSIKKKDKKYKFIKTVGSLIIAVESVLLIIK